MIIWTESIVKYTLVTAETMLNLVEKSLLPYYIRSFSSVIITA